MKTKPTIESSRPTAHEFFIAGIDGEGQYGRFASTVSIHIYNARNAREARQTLRDWLKAIGANVSTR